MGFGFSPKRFNALLSAGGLGQRATWERVSKCPCRSTRTGGASVICQVCGGTGYVWQAPQAVEVGLTAMKTDRKQAQPTQWEDGDIVCSIGSDSPAYAAGEFDRITLTDASLRISEVLARSGATDKLKYRVPLEIVDAWCIVANVKTALVSPTHYTLAGNVLTWTGEAPVTVTQQFSITYRAKPDYFVFREYVQDRPMSSLALPRKVHLRLMELFGRAVA